MRRTLAALLALAAAPAIAGPVPAPAQSTTIAQSTTTQSTTPAQSTTPPQSSWPAPWFWTPPAPTLPGEPLAGYNAGSFYLRDPHNWFVLFPKGRLQIDWYNFLNRGDPPAGVDPNSAKDPRPKDTLFVRRVRPEIQGIIANHFEFQLGGEFGTVPGVGQYGTLTDAFINVNYTPYLQLQVGQFDAPFTLENRTSDKYFDFMERSLAVRAFGVPANKDDGGMLWGYFPNKLLYYSFGVFNGDGQGYKNQDNKPALIGRAFVAPLAPWSRGRRWIEELWVGGSIWWQPNTNLGEASGVAPSVTGSTLNDLSSMTTQGGFGFFSSNYNNGTDANKNPIRSHLAPNGDTLKWAVEANIPIWKLGARFELVHQSIALGQYNDSTNLMTASVVRTPGPVASGVLEGYGYYVELYGWLLGDRTMLEMPGIEPMPRLNRFVPAAEPKWGLMLAARYEHLGFNVNGLTPAGAKADPAQGDYSIDAVEVGLNAWLTKHVRLTCNYVLNYIGGFDAKATTDPANTDAANLKKNFFYGRGEHELLFRAAVAL